MIGACAENCSRKEKSQTRITIFLVILLLLVPTALAIGYTGQVISSEGPVQELVQPGSQSEPAQMSADQTQPVTAGTSTDENSQPGQAAEGQQTAEQSTEQQPELPQPQSDSCSGVICSPDTRNCLDGTVAECTGFCSPETGQCLECTPSCEGHENASGNVTQPAQPPECSLICGLCQELNITVCICNPIIPCCGNGVCEENETCVSDCQQPPNETTNETINETTPGLPAENGTTIEIPSTNETNQTGNATEPEPAGESLVAVSLQLPSKTNRGETVQLKAMAESTGTAEASSVRLTWYLPPGFSITEGSSTKACGTLQQGETCESVISVISEYTAGLGLNNVRVQADYG